MKEIKLGVTGHRPTNKEQYEDAALNRLTAIIVDELVKLQQQYVITELRSGMALYFDTACCLAAIHFNIPFIAEVPFALQWTKWNKQHQLRYFDLLSKAKEVVYVDALPNYKTNTTNVGLYHVSKLYKRNEHIMDNSDYVLTYYDNSGKGGTASAIRYASKLRLPITNIFEAINNGN